MRYTAATVILHQQSPLARVWQTSASLATDDSGARDPHGLLGVRDGDTPVRGYGDGVDGAGLAAAVTAVTGRDLRAEKPSELLESGRLVAFDLHVRWAWRAMTSSVCPVWVCRASANGTPARLPKTVSTASS
ncbi:hypothetical protein ACQP2F_15930 [Actinoplanes sp. CA-030573]|uniref:hypothetical protein n=1 Tax=Actinoplanes sp. CA-030573 TaxID=3239898 RepID=UPI003D935FDA